MSLRRDTWLAFDVWVEFGEGLDKLERLQMVRKVTQSTEQCLSYLGDAEKAKKALEGVTSIADGLLRNS